MTNIPRRWCSWSARRAGTNVGSLAFTLWDASVPILPFVSQLLLAVFLAIGGYRRYLRR